jgi:DNA helicase-2/ATP-dependent DNA helicase PcrA
VSSITLCDKRKAIIKQEGHVLVTGGPGSGKTTVALLKAADASHSLRPGEEILFLSFSRSAIQQILQKSQDLLNRDERSLIRVQTYHAFCIELLESHGRLLSGRRCKFVVPGEERLRKAGFEGRWDAERERMASQESAFCFDLLAPGAADLFEKSTAVRTLLTSKFPMVICDEFQDTDDDQWRIVQAMAMSATMCCLADPEQRIFDYRPNVNPLRVQQLREKLAPAEFGLGSENHRSPNGGILQFADCVLQNRVPLPKTNDVTFVIYHGKDFETIFHAATVWTFSEIRKRGVEHPSVAVLCRNNKFVATLSDILQTQHTFKGNTLRPIEHGVVWDAELAVAAAVTVASIMEWLSGDATTLAKTLNLLCRYYQLKNAEKTTKKAADAALKCTQMAEAVEAGSAIRSKALQQFRKAFTDGINFVGDPMKDWVRARSVLQSVTGFEDVFGDASMVRLFGAREALVSGLADLWLAAASYVGAAERVRTILDRQRLLESERTPHGCMLMTIHKSKGKEFDGVVLVEDAHRAPFFDTAREPAPFERSRRLLRVGLTRAKHFVTIIRPNGATPLVG